MYLCSMKKNIILYSCTALIVLLFSCHGHYGEVVIREKVNVFYLSPATQNEAQQLADYWVEKQLTSDEVQYLQLTKHKDVMKIKLVSNDSTCLNEIPFEIQLQLVKLDSMLNQDLFGEHIIELYVSDKIFDRTKKIF